MMQQTASNHEMVPPRIDLSYSADSADRGQFIDAMGRAVTGVNVNSTDGPAGRFAVTVSAVSSVSADPPMVLACINRRSPACEALRENGVFCVNVLGADQTHVSDTFAGRPASGRPFDFGCAGWEDAVTGSPRLLGAVASFDCAVESAVDAGSHTIFVGRVLAVRQADEAPLLYTRQSYGQAVPLAN
jgi:flavin reductase